MNELVLGQPGLHALVATVRWGLSSTGGRTITLRVMRDGVAVSQAQNFNPPTPAGNSMTQVVLQHIAEAGDVVQIVVRQSSGADLDVLAGETRLQIARLAR